jgi:methylmalonyl-CoA mutase
MNDEYLFNEFPPVNSDEWEGLINKDLKGKSFDSICWKPSEGLNFKPFYTMDDLEKISSKSGRVNYSNNIHIKGNQWEIRQDINIANEANANNKALDILNKGIDSLAFYVNPDTNLNILLKNIELEHISCSFLAGEGHLGIFNKYMQLIRERCLSGEHVKGSIDYDPVGLFLTTGNWKTNQGKDLADAAEILNKLNENGFVFFRGITVHAEHYQNAGANIVQELAFTLSHGVEYLSALTDKGIEIDNICSRIGFSFSIGPSYLTEIAKIRAFRHLWAKIIEQYKPKDTCSMETYIHCSTSKFYQAVADSYNNILRATTETMSAAIGGANSISVAPFDAAYSNPNDFSERIARNIQIICAEEAYLNKIIDPAGGSYYIENITQQLIEATWKLFQSVEAMGGLIEAAKKGYVQDEIEKAASTKVDAIKNSKTVMIGVNKYINSKDNIAYRISELPKPGPEKTMIRPLKFFRNAEQIEKEMTEKIKD